MRFLMSGLLMFSLLALMGFSVPAFAQQSSMLYSAQNNAGGQTIQPPPTNFKRTSSRTEKLSVPGTPGFFGQPAQQAMQGVNPQQAGQTSLQQPGQIQQGQGAQATGYIYKGLVASPMTQGGSGATVRRSTGTGGMASSGAVYRGLVVAPVARPSAAAATRSTSTRTARR